MYPRRSRGERAHRAIKLMRALCQKRDCNREAVCERVASECLEANAVAYVFNNTRAVYPTEHYTHSHTPVRSSALLMPYRQMLAKYIFCMHAGCAILRVHIIYVNYHVDRQTH